MIFVRNDISALFIFATFPLLQFKFVKVLKQIHTMRDFIKRNIQGKKVLLLFIATNIIYVFMLTVTIPKVMSFANGMKLLDMMPTGYTPEYVNSLLSKLGEMGRHAYLFNQLPVDMIYPGMVAINYCLVIAYFLNKIGKLESNLFYLCLLPIFSGLFDYCENLGIINILRSYPENSDFLSQVTSAFSVLKSISSTVFFTILLIVLVVFGWRKLFKPSSGQN
jgi:hypothetical protein